MYVAYNLQHFIDEHMRGKKRQESIVYASGQMVVKVADFGVAHFQDQGGNMTAETGTYRWMAPEIQLCCWSKVILFQMCLILLLFLKSRKENLIDGYHNNIFYR
jgi:hypothetical protein